MRERSVTVSCSMLPGLADRVGELAAQAGVSRSRFIRRALVQWVIRDGQAIVWLPGTVERALDALASGSERPRSETARRALTLGCALLAAGEGSAQQAGGGKVKLATVQGSRL